MNEFVRVFADLDLEGVFEDPIPQIIAGANGEVIINSSGISVNNELLSTKSYVDSASSTTVHDQIVPEAQWIINHGLNKYPSVTIVDSSGSKVYGDIDYPSMNTITVSFSSVFSGRAFLN